MSYNANDYQSFSSKREVLNEEGWSVDELGQEFGYCNSCGEEANAYMECCDDGEVVPFD